MKLKSVVSRDSLALPEMLIFMSPGVVVSNFMLELVSIYSKRSPAIRKPLFNVSTLFPLPYYTLMLELRKRWLVFGCLTIF